MATAQMSEFGIWAPGSGKYRGFVIAASRDEAVSALARSWFSGVREHAEEAVSRSPVPNIRGLPDGIYDQGGTRARGAGD